MPSGPSPSGMMASMVATVKNASGDELSGHLVRFELYQDVTAVFDFGGGPSSFPLGTNQLDLGTLVAGTPTCPALGCAAFANTGSGLAAGGFPVSETAGQAKMSWTDIDSDPFTGLGGYLGTLAGDTVVACLADDGTGVAAAPTCGMVIYTFLDTSGLVLPGDLNIVSFSYYAPN